MMWSPVPTFNESTPVSFEKYSLVYYITPLKVGETSANPFVYAFISSLPNRIIFLYNLITLDRQPKVKTPGGGYAL